MTGVTSNGWEGKTFQEIVDELAESATEEFGEDFPTTPDSVFGQLANIFAASTKDLYDLGQAIADAQNRDAAEGVYLDYLAALIGLTRLPDSGSSGDLLFTGSQGTVVSAFFPCKDNLSRNVLTDEELTLNRSLCYQSTFSIGSVTASTDYTLVVEGDNFTYTSGISPTEQDILDGLKASLDTGSGFSSEVIDTTLVVTLDSFNNVLTTTNSSNISLDSIGSLVSATAATTGDLDFPADTVTKLVTSSLGISSVTNPQDFTEGREEETDEELRLRMDEREQSTGTATKPSIEASISEITGVTGVLIKENDTLDTDIDGVPAKSYETFVTGGDDDDIAEVIWETKPVGIYTHGDVVKVVVDQNGDEQTVRFSRKSTEYSWLRITYSINSEEDFPADGEDQMKTAVVDFGNSLDSGEDFEPTKFYAPLYTVSGVYISLIEIATTALSTDTPVYQTTRIAVSETEDLEFSLDRTSIST